MREILRRFNGKLEKEFLLQLQTGKSKLKGLYTFVNPYSYSLLKKEPELCKQFSLMLSDGILLKAIYNIFHFNKKIARISFDMSSLAPIVFKYAIKTGSSVAIIGSKPDSIENFIKIIQDGFPDLDIVYKRHGFFENNTELNNVISEVVALSPDILIAGLGTPFQEKFLVDTREKGWNGLGFTCGGFLSQTQEKLEYYPRWIDKLQLRWAYRIFNEPHTRKRILKPYLFFPIIFVRDFISK